MLKREKQTEMPAPNERFGDSRGETLLKSNSVTSATVPCGNRSVPPPDRQAATTLGAMFLGHSSGYLQRKKVEK